MARKSKLIAALDARKGRDYGLEKQRKQEKQAEKKKREKNLTPNGTGVDTNEDSERSASDNEEQSDLFGDDVEASFPLSDESESDSEEDVQNPLPDTELPTNGQVQANGEDVDEDDEEAEEDDEDKDIPISDIESLTSSVKEDVIPHQRLTINNTTALLSAHNSLLKNYPTTLPFSARQTLTTSTPIQVTDPNDDLTRELAFYEQCLNSATEARSLLKREKIPFTRPNDYFAEMVKSDEHMGKIKQRIVDDAARRKASSDAKRQRDLKKFGKQVQVATMQERAKEKRRMLERVDLLKKKRKGADTGTTNEEDLFDVALEDAAKEERPSKQGGRRDSAPPNKRRKKDAQFGFGGKKRFAKSGDAVSTGDMSGFSAKKMKGKQGKSKRPGKSKRAKM